MENNQITIKGKIDQVIYYNDTNNYMVAVFETESDIIKISGVMPEEFSNAYIELTGSYFQHKKYGTQFKFDYFIPTTPSDDMYIFEYLCQVIRGIGESTAEKILDKFGKETFAIIEHSPEDLLEIEGIGKKKLDMIVDSYNENQQSKNTIIELQKLGLSLKLAVKIYKNYENMSVSIIMKNPYKLCDDVRGIGFKIADEIARKINISKNNEFRIKAGIIYILKDIVSLGHCYLPKNKLSSKSSSLLEITNEEVNQYIDTLAFENKIFIETIDGLECVYLIPFYKAETDVAKQIMNLSSNLAEYEESEALRIIYDSSESFTTEMLTEEQLLAITQAMSEHIFVITGGPGTGKTTIINILLNALESQNKNVALCAPTGRAAKRLSETTKREAKTIHRLLEYSQGEEDYNLIFGKNSENLLEHDIIVVDEASMIDIVLMNNLLKAIDGNSHLILIGDVDQLPSVGAGNVLRDIIDSNIIPTIRLTKIFRQAEGSVIVSNAHKVNSGCMIDISNKNSEFYYINKVNPIDIKSTIVDLYTNRLPNHYGVDAINDIQILTPTKKTDIGTVELNNAIQKIINPKELHVKEKITTTYIFRTGDKVMQIKNNYKIKWKKTSNSNNNYEGEGLYNGDLGIIDCINTDGSIDVLFNDDKLARYESDDINQLILAYACTVHKSQGSEFDFVIIPISSSINHFLLSRNLLYTAITRAKKFVVIVGDYRAIKKMIGNDRVSSRFSALKYRLSDAYDILERENEE